MRFIILGILGLFHMTPSFSNSSFFIMLSVLHIWSTWFSDKCRNREHRAAAACHPLPCVVYPSASITKQIARPTLVFTFTVSVWMFTFFSHLFLSPSSLFRLNLYLSNMSNLSKSFVFLTSPITSSSPSPYADKAVSYIYFPPILSLSLLCSYLIHTLSLPAFCLTLNFCSTFLTWPSFFLVSLSRLSY